MVIIMMLGICKGRAQPQVIIIIMMVVNMILCIFTAPIHQDNLDRSVQSSTISTFLEAYECLKEPIGVENIQQSLKICQQHMAGYPF